LHKTPSQTEEPDREKKRLETAGKVSWKRRLRGKGKENTVATGRATAQKEHVL